MHTLLSFSARKENSPFVSEGASSSTIFKKRTEFSKNVDIENCLFYNCKDPGENGGGLYVKSSSSSVEIAGTGFTGCEGSTGGSFWLSVKQATINKCCIERCEAKSAGGGYIVATEKIGTKKTYFANLPKSEDFHTVSFTTEDVTEFEHLNFTKIKSAKKYAVFCFKSEKLESYCDKTEFTKCEGGIAFIYHTKSINLFKYFNFVKNEMEKGLIQAETSAPRFQFLYILDDRSDFYVTDKSQETSFQEGHFPDDTEDKVKAKCGVKVSFIDCKYKNDDTYDMNFPQNEQCWELLPGGGGSNALKITMIVIAVIVLVVFTFFMAICIRKKLRECRMFDNQQLLRGGYTP